MQRLTHDARRERRRQIAEDAKTMGLAEICEKHGISEQTVRKCTAVAGVPFPSLPRALQLNALRHFMILFRLIHGEHQTSISRSLGISRQAVSKLAEYAESCGFVIPSREDKRS